MIQTVVAFMLILASTVCSEAVERLITIHIGQSNEEGRGKIDELPVYANISRIFAYHENGKWLASPSEPLPRPTTLRAPYTSNLAPAGAGPVIAFADKLAELRPAAEVGVVQCAIGGYGIEYFVPDYRQTSSFGLCVKRAKEALSHPGARLAGFVIGNGEGEANPEKIWTYSPAMSRMIDGFRAQIGNAPVVYKQLGPEPSGNTSFTSWGGLQAIQAELAIPNSIMVVTSDLPAQSPQNPHLTTAGYVEAGRRAAIALHRLLD